MTDFLKITETTDSIKSLAKEKAKRQKELDLWFTQEITKLFVKYFGVLIQEVRRMSSNNPGEKGE